MSATLSALLLRGVARGLLLLAVPLLPLLALRGRAAADGHAGSDDWSATDKLALAIGVLAAPLLLATVAIDHFGLSDVFTTGGPWDLDFAAFLRERLLPLLSAPLDLLRAIARDDVGDDFQDAAALLAAAALGVVALPLRSGRTRADLMAAARRAFLVVWGSYATIYTVSVVAWVANRLNFWCFLVLLAASLLVRED